MRLRVHRIVVVFIGMVVSLWGGDTFAGRQTVTVPYFQLKQDSLQPTPSVVQKPALVPVTDQSVLFSQFSSEESDKESSGYISICSKLYSPFTHEYHPLNDRFLLAGEECTFGMPYIPYTPHESNPPGVLMTVHPWEPETRTFGASVLAKTFSSLEPGSFDTESLKEYGNRLYRVVLVTNESPSYSLGSFLVAVLSRSMEGFEDIKVFDLNYSARQPGEEKDVVQAARHMFEEGDGRSLLIATADARNPHVREVFGDHVLSIKKSELYDFKYKFIHVFNHWERDISAQDKTDDDIDYGPWAMPWLDTQVAPVGQRGEAFSDAVNTMVRFIDEIDGVGLHGVTSQVPVTFGSPVNNLSDHLYVPGESSIQLASVKAGSSDNYLLVWPTNDVERSYAFVQLADNKGRVKPVLNDMIMNTMIVFTRKDYFQLALQKDTEITGMSHVLALTPEVTTRPLAIIDARNYNPTRFSPRLIAREHHTEKTQSLKAWLKEIGGKIDKEAVVIVVNGRPEDTPVVKKVFADRTVVHLPSVRRRAQKAELRKYFGLFTAGIKIYSRSEKNTIQQDFKITQVDAVDITQPQDIQAAIRRKKQIKRWANTGKRVNPVDVLRPRLKP